MSDSQGSKAATEIENASITSTNGSDRTALLSKARAFLRSPSVASQDVTARRQFLSDKGLSGEDIDNLILEVPPPIPPRTYPRPAPSKLPIILYATLKAFMLLTGVSVVTVAMYFTYIYPRLAASFGARSKLSSYQTDLLKRLITGSEHMKSTQKEYRLHPVKVSSASNEANDKIATEATTVPTSEQQSTDEMISKDIITIDASPQSSKSDYDSLISSLQALRNALPRRKAAYNSTLSDMTDMTALITSKMYAPKVHTAIESEIRQEIRAAKGLLLNRKTFTSHRPNVTP